jgi:hypothetical protein
MTETMLGLGSVVAFIALALAAQRWGVDSRDGFTEIPKQVLRWR